MGLSDEPGLGVCVGRNGTALATGCRKAALFPPILSAPAALASSRVPPTRKLVDSGGRQLPGYPRGWSELWAPPGVLELRERRGWGPAGRGRSRTAGRRGAGRGGRRRRLQQQLRCDQARQRRAHRELEVRVAQLSHVSVPAVSGSRGQGGGLERRFRCLPHQCRSIGRGSVVPAAALSISPWTRTRAARCRSFPPSARGEHSFTPQKPPPPGLPRPTLPPSTHCKAQAAGAPRLWSGPGLRAGPRRQPGPWHRLFPGALAAFAAGEAELEMGRVDNGRKSASEMS